MRNHVNRRISKSKELRAVGGLLMLLVVAALARGTREGDSGGRPQDQQPLKLNTTLVQIPAAVNDRIGSPITDLSQGDFSVFEDGKRQEIELFAALNQPFHAVLVLDSSNSAADRLRAIQECAMTFARQIQTDDRLMVMSFDNEVHQLTEFTSDRAEVEAAIRGIQSGYGKLFYESVAGGLDQLKGVEGRRALILFTDGVDLGSVGASWESTIKSAEEIGAVVYVVRFETRWWIESAARRQQAEHPRSKAPFDVDGRIPLPPDFGGPDPNSGIPGRRRPRIEVNSPSIPPVIVVDGKRQETPPAPADEITVAFDKLYGTADGYLQAISSLTGGVVFRAENFDETQSAFRAIAEELRRQYLLGYYVAASSQGSKFHKLKVEVNRKGAVVRTRTGYRR